MAFYKSIADYYDDIFPFSPPQKGFVSSCIPNISDAKLLDIGCGTGNLALALAPLCREIIGIDPDESMLEIARQKTADKFTNLQFHPYGMLDMEEKFKPVSFDAILCFGNTLVHLSTEDEIINFLRQSKHVLKPGGKLLIQIINYDRIIDQDISALPTIENDRIKFVRDYRYHPENNILDFETSLTIKENNQEIKNCIQLLPIRKADLENLMIKAGLTDIVFYGNFKKATLLGDSVPIVIEGMRPEA